MLSSYYRLTKPGIIYGNLLTATAGFLLASHWRGHWWLLVAMLVGTSLVIASACVFNNYIDRDIDVLMARTKGRALVTGKISGRAALTFATLLGAGGYAVLLAYTNSLVVIIGIVAFIDYVILYGFTKRSTVYGTLVGTISGAAPIVAGYCAVTDRFDAGAIILFAILTLWQMPHFYSIAIYRLRDYTAAHIPVLPAVTSLRQTKLQIVTYIVAYIVTTSLLTLYGYTGYVYLGTMLVMGGLWLSRGLKGFMASDDVKWARGMFGFSLVVILSLSVMLAVGPLLP